MLILLLCVDSEGVRESTVSECPGATHEDPGRPGVHLEEGSGGGGGGGGVECKYVVKSNFVSNTSFLCMRENKFILHICMCIQLVHRTGRHMQHRTCLCAPSWRPSLSSSWTGGGRSSGTYMYMYIYMHVPADVILVETTIYCPCCN